MLYMEVKMRLAPALTYKKDPGVKDASPVCLQSSPLTGKLVDGNE